MRTLRTVFVSMFGLLLFISIAPQAHAALTDAQVQAIISLLNSFGADSATVSNVNASLRGQTPSSSSGGTSVNDNESAGGTVSSCPTLTRTLSRGNTDIGTNGEVSQLQGFLSDYLNLGDAINSGYYGILTEKYVKQFQAKNGIEQVGYVGSKTRAAIARVCGTSVVRSEPVSISPLPNATLTASPASGSAPLTVYFQGSGSVLAPSAGISFGDGTTSYEGQTSISHVYQNPGTYTAKLLKDGARGEVVATVTIIVGSTTNNGITVTAPNGGEQWEMGLLNTVTWTPYGYNPDINPARDVTAYLEKSDGNGGFITLGKVEESGKASIHWTVGQLNSNSGNNETRTYVSPGSGYYVRVVNNMTGASDRSDKPFTLLPRPVDLKVNGSDGPIYLSDPNQTVSVSWTTNNVSTCQLGGITEQSFSTIQPPVGQVSGHVSSPYSANYYTVSLQCVKQTLAGPVQVVDSVSVFFSTVSQTASLQIVSPNGGEQIDPTKQMFFSYKSSGLSILSIALYKNDQWLYWIQKDVPIQSVNLGWTPSSALSGLGMGSSAGAIFKIYMTGQKADGTRYVEDKSDAPFSFSVTGTTTPSATATINASSLTSSSNHPTISGTAQNTSLIGLSISKYGGKFDGTGKFSVVNGMWSVTLNNETYTPGSYGIDVYNGDNTLLASGTLTVVGSSSTSTPPTPPVSTPGPKVNKMSCANSSRTGLASGTLACYGLWDFGNEFGEDQNMCPTNGYSTASTGCVVSVPACQSGKATATRVLDTYAPWHSTSGPALASVGDIATIATNMNSTPSAVSSQIIRIWEYTCN